MRIVFVIIIVLVSIVTIYRQTAMMDSYDVMSNLVATTQKKSLTAKTAAEQDAAETSMEKAGNNDNHGNGNGIKAVSMPNSLRTEPSTTTEKKTRHIDFSR